MTLLLSSCQLGYMMKSGYNQLSLMSDRVSVEKVLADPTVDEGTKAKLRLSQEVREFSEKDLHLASSKNYTSFVQLDRPYVSYIVSASQKWKLEHHLWYFPFVGHVPYKGYFKEADAKKLQEELKKEDYDTYIRGVSAYSTLGWFNDPLLSSMLRYKEHDLVNTLIHETVHATLYIKSSADFNERMAVFLGNKGTEIFYRKKEGDQSLTLQAIQKENEDDKKFSAFITHELQSLESWYQALPADSQNEELRQKRFKEIKDHFLKDLKPTLQTNSYKNFEDAELNNARLMVYKTYMQDLSDFESLYQLVQGDFARFLECCQRLKKHDKPEDGLKEIIEDLKRSGKNNCAAN